MNLDITSLTNAIAQLEEALELYNDAMVVAVPKIRYHIRAAAIQAFEFTYELAYKSLKRYLNLTAANPSEVEDMTFDAIIRRGYDLGLLARDVVTWRGYRKERGTSSHAYDGGKAEIVFEQIPAFLDEVRYLQQQLLLKAAN